MSTQRRVRPGPKRPRGSRRAGAAGVALMLGGAGILLGVAAAPAQAAEVSYATDCVPPPVSGLPPVEGTTKVEITAPAEAKVGDEVEVVWKFDAGRVEEPRRHRPATGHGPADRHGQGGRRADRDLAMQGPRENPAIPKGRAMVLSDMKGKLKLTTAGEVTLTPDTYDINVSDLDGHEVHADGDGEARGDDQGHGGGGATTGGSTGRPIPPGPTQPAADERRAGPDARASTGRQRHGRYDRWRR